METDTPITDEMLIALADGELDAGTAAQVRAQFSRDPEMASRFAGLAEVRALLSTGSDEDVMLVPDRLTAAILKTDETARPDAARRVFGVIDGSRAASRTGLTPSRSWSVRRFMLPLAASVSLLVGSALGWFLGTRSGMTPGLGLELSSAAVGTVTAALDGLPSGQMATFSDPLGSVRGTVVMVASYKVDGGGVCRTFDIAFEGAQRARETRVSCRRNGTWHTELTLARPPRGAGFVTASGGDDVVDQYLNQAGGGQSLSVEDERQALKR